jgi:NAD(P)-dependent dehydrogenase (short-subunit alcohol dehydrogenase family)
MTPKADHGETSYKGSGRLAGRKALVTGGDSGIGRAVAIAFAKEGADVLISYLSEQEDANETVRQVEAAGQKAVAVMGDIEDEAHCKELVQQAIDEFGQLDILVNNAAFQMNHDSFLDIPSEEFEKTYRTNIFAMFYLCKAAVPVMKPGGSIINTASIQAYMPEPSLLAYAGTKAAIVNFSKALAKEAIEHGIRVNAVAPGPVWTPLIPATMPEDKVKTFGEDSLLGRAAQPVELAPIYVLLASQEASYITGMIYGATGGRPIG